MTISAIIPWIPKLAATLLVLLAILIAMEIRAMFRKKDIPVPGGQAAEPVPMTKVHFPDTAVHTEILQTNKNPSGYKKLLISIPIVLILLFVFVSYLGNHTNQQTTTTPTVTPQNKPEIAVYRFGEVGDLELLNYDDLKSLEPNTEIIIAIAVDSSIQKATFTVNDEEIISNLQDRTPSGEYYISYILKPGVVDYHISVRVE